MGQEAQCLYFSQCSKRKLAMVMVVVGEGGKEGERVHAVALVMIAVLSLYAFVFRVVRQDLLQRHNFATVLVTRLVHCPISAFTNAPKLFEPVYGAASTSRQFCCPRPGMSALRLCQCMCESGHTLTAAGWC